MKTAEVEELTPDYVKSVGKEWVDHLMSVLPAEERLKGLNAREVLQRYGPKERLEGLGPKERLEGLGPKERLEGLGLDERLEGLTPEQLKALKEKLKNL